MRNLLRLALLGAAIAGAVGTSGCVVRERPVVVARPTRCPGGVWVQGHRDRYGVWHHAHWRCPGVIDVY